MAEPIHHTTGSTILTGASKAAKYGIVGLLALPILGGLIGASVVGGLAAAAVGALVGVGVAMTVGAPLTAGIAAIAATFGLAKGANQVASENAAYQDKVANQGMSRQQKFIQKFNEARNEGLQQGYLMGAQERESQIAEHLQKVAMVQKMQHGHEHAAPHEHHNKEHAHGHAAHEKTGGIAPAAIKEQQAAAQTPGEKSL